MIDDAQREQLRNRIIVVLFSSEFKTYLANAFVCEIAEAIKEAYVLPGNEDFAGQITVKFVGFDPTAQTSRLFYEQLTNGDLLDLIAGTIWSSATNEDDLHTNMLSLYTFWSFNFRIKGDPLVLDIELTIRQVS